MVNPQLGRRIRAARMELGLSGTELARTIGKSQPYISDLERGQRTPSLPTLKALADALEKPVSFFLSGEDTPPWPDRALPNPKAAELKRMLAEHIVEQLLTARLLRSDEGKDRDALLRVVERAIHNAYHEMRPASRTRQAARTAAGTSV